MAGEILRLAANATRARLFDASREVKVTVSSLLSYEIEGAQQTEVFKSRKWDGRSSFFDFREGSFPSGFVSLVARELSRLGHTIRVIQKPLPAPLGLADPAFASFDGRAPSDRYDYQPETVRRLLRHGRMVAQCATGGGKSRIAGMAVAALRLPTLFLTTRSMLMHQMAENFADAGFIPGTLGDGLWAPRKGVNVGMVQTLAPRLEEGHPEREQTLKLLSYFGLIIGEEAHEAGGSSYFDILNACTNAHYRLALTATPFMRPDGEANMRLMAAFGPVGIQITEKLLIDRGILATPSFKLLRSRVPATLRRTTKWPTCSDLGVVENEFRNRDGVREVLRGVEAGLSCLMLVQRKKHGQILLKMLQEHTIRAEFIFGETDKQTREAALGRLKSGATQVLIASTILDVGVDVPSLGLVANMGAGKAEVGMRQRIGRGLREKHNGANVCFFVDFMDESNDTLYKHALTRRSILETTPGFAEGILPDGADFDYAGLQQSRAA